MISLYDYALLVRSLGVIEGAVSCASEDVKTVAIGEFERIDQILEKLERELEGNHEN